MRASLPAAIHRSAQAQAAFPPAASASAKTVMQSIPDRTGNLSMAPALVAAHAGPQSKATASASSTPSAMQKGCYVTSPLAVEQALALKLVLDLFPVAPGKAVNVDPSAVAIADLQSGCAVGMSGTAAEAITP